MAHSGQQNLFQSQTLNEFDAAFMSLVPEGQSLLDFLNSVMQPAREDGWTVAPRATQMGPYVLQSVTEEGLETVPNTALGRGENFGAAEAGGGRLEATHGPVGASVEMSRRSSYTWDPNSPPSSVVSPRLPINSQWGLELSSYNFGFAFGNNHPAQNNGNSPASNQSSSNSSYLCGRMNSGSHSFQGVEQPTKAIATTSRLSPSSVASSSSQWRGTEGLENTQQARVQKKRKVQNDFGKLNITGEEEAALNEQPWYNGLDADNYISPVADIKTLYTCGVNGCTIKIQGDRHNIAAHMKTHTFTPIPQANGKEKVLCGDANHQPLLRSDMDKHFRDRHFLSGSHSCSICHAVSVNDYSARRHVKETCFPRRLQAFQEERAADSEASSSKRARRK